MVKINDKIKKLKDVKQYYHFLDLQVSKLDCVGNLMNSIIRLIEKNKYVYLDVGTGGVYLIDCDDNVYSIKGYGKKGYFVGKIEVVTQDYQKKINYMTENYEIKKEVLRK